MLCVDLQILMTMVMSMMMRMRRSKEINLSVGETAEPSRALMTADHINNTQYAHHYHDNDDEEDEAADDDDVRGG